VRFFAVHDLNGNIFSLVGSPSKGPMMTPLMLGTNNSFSEVTLPARLFNPDNPKSYVRLAEVPANYLVKMPPSKPAKLLKKPPVEPSEGRLATLTIFPDVVSRWIVPRFEVTLKEATNVAVQVQIVMDPDKLLGTMVIPPGMTAHAMSTQLPSPLASGMHIVSAIGSEGDTVTAQLQVL
jgi:hypothetical protein